MRSSSAGLLCLTSKNCFDRGMLGCPRTIVAPQANVAIALSNEFMFSPHFEPTRPSWQYHVGRRVTRKSLRDYCAPNPWRLHLTIKLSADVECQRQRGSSDTSLQGPGAV